MKQSAKMNSIPVVLMTACFAFGCSPSDPAPHRAADSDSAATPDDSAAVELVPVEPGFERLRLADFEEFYAKGAGKEPTWTEAGSTLRCTGQPRGYLYTKRPFGDFTLRLDVRYPAADVADESTLNTGVLAFITGKHKQWPASLEVQGKYLELGTIKANGGAAQPEIQDDESARRSARKPPSEWNSLEIVAKDGALTVRLNGTQTCESAAGELKEGAIGLQSEGAEVEFRDVRIGVSN